MNPTRLPALIESQFLMSDSQATRVAALGLNSVQANEGQELKSSGKKARIVNEMNRENNKVKPINGKQQQAKTSVSLLTNNAGCKQVRESSKQIPSSAMLANKTQARACGRADNSKTPTTSSPDNKQPRSIKKAFVRFDDYLDLNEENMRRSCKRLMNHLYSESASDQQQELPETIGHSANQHPIGSDKSAILSSSPNSAKRSLVASSEIAAGRRTPTTLPARARKADAHDPGKAPMTTNSNSVGKSYLRSQYERRQLRQLELRNKMQASLNTESRFAAPAAATACTASADSAGANVCRQQQAQLKRNQQQDFVAKSHELSKRRFFEKLEQRESMKNSLSLSTPPNEPADLPVHKSSLGAKSAEQQRQQQPPGTSAEAACAKAATIDGKEESQTITCENFEADKRVDADPSNNHEFAASAATMAATAMPPASSSIRLEAEVDEQKSVPKLYDQVGAAEAAVTKGICLPSSPNEDTLDGSTGATGASEPSIAALKSTQPELEPFTCPDAGPLIGFSTLCPEQEQPASSPPTLNNGSCGDQSIKGGDVTNSSSSDSRTIETRNLDYIQKDNQQSHRQISHSSNEEDGVSCSGSSSSSGFGASVSVTSGASIETCKRSGDAHMGSTDCTDKGVSNAGKHHDGYRRPKSCAVLGDYHNPSSLGYRPAGPVYEKLRVQHRDQPGYAMQLGDEFKKYEQLVGPDQAYPRKDSAGGMLLIENHGYATVVSHRETSQKSLDDDQTCRYANLRVRDKVKPKSESTIEYATIGATTSLIALGPNIACIDDKSKLSRGSSNMYKLYASDGASTNEEPSHSSDDSTNSGGFSGLPPVPGAVSITTSKADTLDSFASDDTSTRLHESRKSSLFKRFGSFVTRAFSGGPVGSIDSSAPLREIAKCADDTKLFEKESVDHGKPALPLVSRHQVACARQVNHKSSHAYSTNMKSMASDSNLASRKQPENSVLIGDADLVILPAKNVKQRKQLEQHQRTSPKRRSDHDRLSRGKSRSRNNEKEPERCSSSSSSCSTNSSTCSSSLSNGEKQNRRRRLKHPTNRRRPNESEACQDRESSIYSMTQPLSIGYKLYSSLVLSSEQEQEQKPHGSGGKYQSLSLYHNLLRNYAKRRRKRHSHGHRDHEHRHHHHHQHHYSMRNRQTSSLRRAQHTDKRCAQRDCGKGTSSRHSNNDGSTQDHSCNCDKAPVRGQLIKINKSDGTQVIELQRSTGKSWGFFVARGYINGIRGELKLFIQV